MNPIIFIFLFGVIYGGIFALLLDEVSTKHNYFIRYLIVAMIVGIILNVIPLYYVQFYLKNTELEYIFIYFIGMGLGGFIFYLIKKRNSNRIFLN